MSTTPSSISLSLLHINDSPHISSPPHISQDTPGITPYISPQPAPKKKKKKKSKKPKSIPAEKTHHTTDDGKQQVLCISRNKHWRYISSYHGPWLQLPIELLESLSVVNSNPQAFSAPEPHFGLPRLEPSFSPPHTPVTAGKRRDRGFESIPEASFLESRLISASTGAQLRSFHDFGRPVPPPIDPGVFKSATSIRRLIDEASELSVRASSGLSAAELGSIRGSPSLNSSTWATAQALGINPLGNVGNGRNVTMSAMRIHRLRALAVQKLAQAYRMDEIASSVMVMQGGSVFDDLAERVLKADPLDCDARYVHFFHEKIPSRQLAESTSTKVLDELIAAQPQYLHYYRTRGIVHCFRDEYPQAIKDFTFALKEARAVRRAKFSAHNNQMGDNRKGGKKKRRGNSKFITEAPLDTLNSADLGFDLPEGESPQAHPSTLPQAPDPIEPQLLFMRGTAHLQHAIFLIEGAILHLEGVTKEPSADGAELRLCYLDGSKFGGVEIRNPLGPLGNPRGPKAQAYRAVLTKEPLKHEVISLVKKSIRDHEKFLSHFDTLESPATATTSTLEERVAAAFAISDAIRPGNQHASIPSPHPSIQATFTTYHPLLVEAHFSILLCLIILADFTTVLPTFIRTAALVDGLEGYPVFLPPRSMSQAEFIEILERLACWKAGTEPIASNKALVPFSSGSLNAASSSSRTSSIHSSPTTSAVDFSPSPSRVHPNTGSDSDSESVSTKREQSQEENLECIRILLGQVLKRQKEQVERAAAPDSGVKRPAPINIPLHGPRIEVILAWLAAVHLVELDGAA